LKGRASATLKPPAIDGSWALGRIALDEVEWGRRRQICQDRLQPNFVIDLPECIDALLQTFDEFAIALEVSLIDIQTGDDAKEALEFGNAHHVRGWLGLALGRRS
jgi:hypothetical protein